jgi:hypothetical protein
MLNLNKAQAFHDSSNRLVQKLAYIKINKIFHVRRSDIL